MASIVWPWPLNVKRSRVLPMVSRPCLPTLGQVTNSVRPLGVKRSQVLQPRWMTWGQIITSVRRPLSVKRSPVLRPRGMFRSQFLPHQLRAKLFPAIFEHKIASRIAVSATEPTQLVLKPPWTIRLVFLLPLVRIRVSILQATTAFERLVFDLQMSLKEILSSILLQGPPYHRTNLPHSVAARCPIPFFLRHPIMLMTAVPAWASMTNCCLILVRMRGMYWVALMRWPLMMSIDTLAFSFLKPFFSEVSPSWATAALISQSVSETPAEATGPWTWGWLVSHGVPVYIPAYASVPIYTDVCSWTACRDHVGRVGPRTYSRRVHCNYDNAIKTYSSNEFWSNKAWMDKKQSALLYDRVSVTCAGLTVDLHIF